MIPGQVDERGQLAVAEHDRPRVADPRALDDDVARGETRRVRGALAQEDDRRRRARFVLGFHFAIEALERGDDRVVESRVEAGVVHLAVERLAVVDVLARVAKVEEALLDDGGHLQDAVARGMFPAVAVVELDDGVAEAGDAPGDVHAVLVFLRGPLRGGEPAR